MSIEGQGHFFTIYFPGFVCFVLYQAKISGERLQDHWSSGFKIAIKMLGKIASQLAHCENEICLPRTAVKAVVTFLGHVRCFLGELKL